MSLTSRLVESLRNLNALERGSGYLVAVSAGLDSSVLACLLAGLKNDWDLRICLVYIHHGLRDEADEDHGHVAAMAGRLGCTFVSESIEPLRISKETGESLQECSRRLRYDVLEAVRSSLGLDWIVTAHHSDDQAETLLLRFLSGSGVSGLSGIRPLRDRVVRPLLFARKSELREYAVQNGIEWLEDSSNSSDKYPRNRIRRELIPVIENRLNPGLSSTLSRTAELFAFFEEWLIDALRGPVEECLDIAGDELCLAIQPLKGYLTFLQFLLIRHGIAEIRHTEPAFRDVEAVCGLLLKQPGTQVSLAGGFLACRERTVIRIVREPSETPSATDVALGEEIEYSGGRFASLRVSIDEISFDTDPSSEFIDLDAAGYSWTLRTWTAGDYFFPAGSGIKRKISDFLSDKHIGRLRKNRVAVLESQSRVIWICGMRLDERFKITSETKNAARVTFDVMDS